MKPRLPKEVILHLMKELQKDPFMETMEEIEQHVVEAEKKVQKAIDFKAQCQRRLEAKIVRDKEVADTIKYIEEELK